MANKQVRTQTPAPMAAPEMRFSPAAEQVVRRSSSVDAWPYATTLNSDPGTDGGIHYNPAGNPDTAGTGILPFSQQNPYSSINLGYTSEPTTQTTTWSTDRERPALGETDPINFPDAPVFDPFASPDQPDRSEFADVTMDPLPTMGKTDPIVIPGFEMPTMETIDEFAAPVWDEGEIKSRTQGAADVGMRQLRNAVQTAMAQNFDNPNVKRMTLRDALAGFGIGVGGVMESARKQAVGEYTEKYAREYDAASKNYSTKVQGVRDRFQGAITGKVADYNAAVNGIMSEYNNTIAMNRDIYQSNANAVIAKYNASYNKAAEEYRASNTRDQNKFQADYNAALEHYQTNNNFLRDKYLSDVESERLRWTAENDRRNSEYDKAWDEYINSGTTTTTTSTGGPSNDFTNPSIEGGNYWRPTQNFGVG